MMRGLELRQLTEHADAVLPIDNARLSELSSPAVGTSNPGGSPAAGGGSAAVKKKGGLSGGTGFDEMNDVVARLLTDLTASMRFTGQLNTDLNEITTNLVPFPRMHYVSDQPKRASERIGRLSSSSAAQGGRAKARENERVAEA